MDTEKLAFRISEVVLVTGLPRSTIYELIGAGLLPARKVGMRTLVLRDDLLRFLESLPEKLPGGASERAG